jgi:hypothetical protein
LQLQTATRGLGPRNNAVETAVLATAELIGIDGRTR